LRLITDGINVAPVALSLRMLKRITVDLTGAGKQEACTHSLCQTQHVQRSHHVGLDGLDGVELVMNGGSGASQVVDLVNLQEDGFNDVVPNQFEVGVPHVMQHVLFSSSEEVIHHDHAVASFQETVHQVASNETGSAGHHDPLLLLPLNSPRHPSLLVVVLFQQHAPSWQSQLGLQERLLRSCYGGRRRENMEEDGGDCHAHEEERDTLAQHVTDSAGGFWSGIGRRR